MDPGELRERIRIQKLTQRPQGSVGTSDTYETIMNGREFAKVRSLSAVRRIEMQNAGSPDTPTHTFTTRYREDVRASMRVLWSGTRYRVLAARDVDGDRRFLEVVTAQEGTA